jgi:hypothetical protein
MAGVVQIFEEARKKKHFQFLSLKMVIHCLLSLANLTKKIVFNWIVVSD